MPGEFRPAFETVLAGNHELRIGKMKWRTAHRVSGLVLQPRMMARDALERGCGSSGTGAEKVFGLFSVLFEVGLIGKRFIGHTKPLSLLAWSPL
ncbi:MAG TPA: hypothetical protein VHC72_14330 [Bryobacteraceae bacterium]|nr:hypothetical protein [Bryobacteraceae bacterium]